MGLGGVPGARVAGRYRLTRPATAHGHEVGRPLVGHPAGPGGPVPGELWLAHDEVLGRAVLVRLLPASDPAAGMLLQAAGRAARLVDAGALAVLDAATGPLALPCPDTTDAPSTEGAPRSAGAAGSVVYVVGEWVEAVDLATLLAAGPLPGPEAARIAAEVARVLGHAHREGLAHQRVIPEDVLLTESGRVALAGLGVEAVLHGQDHAASDEAQLADLRAAGAVLYAGLTARWPLEPSCGRTSLPAAPREGRLACAPRQVRAAVPAELDELACRALGAPRRGQLPVASADELAELLAGVTRPGRPAAGWPVAPRGAGWPGPTTGEHPALDDATDEADGWSGSWSDSWPRPESRRTVGAAAAVVGTVLAAGVALLAWQVLAPPDAGPRVLAPNPGAVAADGTPGASPGDGEEGTLSTASARAFDPQGDGRENDGEAGLAVDGDPSTAWTTQLYYGSPHLGGLKDGVGLVVDLGRVRDVRTVGLDLVGRGTDLQVRAAGVPSGTPLGGPGQASPPSRLDGFPLLLGSATDAGSAVAVRSPEPVPTRYLLVWLTSLPAAGTPEPMPGAGVAAAGVGAARLTGSDQQVYRGGVAEVRVSGPEAGAR